jgi:multimeric flavodoxin WrbA
MSKSFLIVNGSPRKNGNTAYLISKLIEGISETHPDADIEVINLRTMKIGPCRACDACRKEDRKQPYCAFQDDMAGLYEKVVQCDALVLASPIYWFSITAQMKLFMDRLYGLWLEKTHSLQNKTFAGILVYGDPDPYISGAVNAIRMIEDTSKYCKGTMAGIVYGTANDIGDAQKNEELSRKTVMLGQTLL